MRNSLKTEVTTALKRSSNIARLTIAGFLFVLMNSIGYLRRAIFLMGGKVDMYSMFNRHGLCVIFKYF